MSETNKVILEVDVPKGHEINGVELFARDAHGNVKTRMLYNDPTMLPNNFRIIERAQVVLDGWKLAPVEPVQGMAGAGWSVIDSLHELESMRLPPQLPQKIYRAMLLAAPSPVAARAVWDDASVAAIKYALQNGLDGLDFLRYWNEGEFDIVRREWPDAPESVFIGADPLYAASNDATDFEHYLQQMIDDAPEPLRRLGQWLGKVLDDDHWPTAERMLLGACKAAAAQQTHTSAGVPEQGVLEIKTDREMLVYLMNAFDNERHVCNVCGHEESTKDIDSAHFLREHLASYPAPTPAGVPDEELARLREIEHRAWHLLDAATTEGEGDYEKLTIDGYLSREDLDVLNELLPEDHPPIDETGREALRAQMRQLVEHHGKAIAAALAQPTSSDPAEDFCDGHCTWRDHAPGCVRAGYASSDELLSPAPCTKCGYNGPGYYQPLTHPCAAAQGDAVPVPQLSLGQRSVAFELLKCFEAWEPMTCVLGNIRARDGADLMRALLGARWER